MTCSPAAPGDLPVPKVGDTVLYFLNDDLCPSPALVINTLAATRHEVLAAHQPRDPDTGTPLQAPDSDRHLDLLVHGLVRSYRRYNVPAAGVPTPGCWTPTS